MRRSEADVMPGRGRGELQQGAALGADGIPPEGAERPEGKDLQDGPVPAAGDPPLGRPEPVHEQGAGARAGGRGRKRVKSAASSR